MRRHGSNAPKVLRDARFPEGLGRNFGGGLTQHEIEYLVAEEWAETAEDVLWRRTKCGLHMTPQQRDAQAFVRKLVNWRKSQAVIHHGKTMQFGPENDTWVYFRYDDKKRVMVAFNKNKTAVSLPTARFQEILKGAKSGVDALTGKRYDLTDALALPARAVVILEI